MDNIIGLRGDTLKNLEIFFITSKFYNNFARNLTRIDFVSLRENLALKFQPGPA